MTSYNLVASIQAEANELGRNFMPIMYIILNMSKISLNKYLRGFRPLL